MKTLLLATLLCTAVACPSFAKPKKQKGVPPGQLRKAEVHDALARGESPSRRKGPPEKVYRSWTPEREYYWNDNRYRWSGGSWVVILD